MSKLRIAAAIVAMLLVQWSTGTLLALTTSTNGSVVQSILSSFLGAAAGGFIAKRNFLAPAILVWALIWGVLTYTLHSIASAAGDASVIELIMNNTVPMLTAGFGVVAGALIGQYFSNRPRITAAT